MNERLAKWKKKLTKENMAVAALLGLLLMVIAIPAGVREKKAEPDEGAAFSEASGKNAAASSPEAGAEPEYAGLLEERLEELLSSMEGVGEVKVMVTLRSFGQQVVEKDIPQETEQTEETDSAGGTRQT